jgi:hypothetical protein
MIFERYFRPAYPGEKNSYSRGWGMTRKKEQADVRVPYLPPLKATDALAKFSPATAPLFQNHIPGTQNHSPENFRKNLEKWHLHSVAAPRII